VAQPARFNFDLDMGQKTKAAPAKPTVPEDMVAMLVAQAREQAFAEGLAEGERSATAQAAQTLASAAGMLATHGAEMAAALDDATAQAQREAIDLASTVGRKLALHLLARYPTVELGALIAECMQSLGGVPHLVVRCHPSIADGIRDIATEHMKTSGFSGRLVIMGDPDQRVGDGKLEWVDGGLVRDIGAVSKDIDKKISAYLAAKSGKTIAQESGH
jgi:flagellar assembly protein FliH|tara:strand:+ start:23347 stop:23997 length:651 start_codon:yes stop_codon:yes gene_type:complete